MVVVLAGKGFAQSRRCLLQIESSKRHGAHGEAVRGQVKVSLGSPHGENLVALACVEIALGRPAEGERLAREAREVLVGSERLTLSNQAWPAWIVGRALAAQGKVEEARSELERGLSLFEEAEEADLAEQVRDELAALGHDSREGLAHGAT